MSDSEGEYEEATPEQKVFIATYFINSSPTGEVDDVLADVNKLVNDPSVLNDGTLNKILQDYNMEQLTVANDSEGNPVLVSPNGRVADDLFLDPNTGRVLKFDHRKRAFLEETDQKQVLNDDVEEYRKAIQTVMDEYAKNSFKEDKCHIAVYGVDSGDITVCVSAANVHLGNFWTGGWKAVYSLNIKGSAELKGTVKINVHYFEDGNVQLHSSITKSAKIGKMSAAETAKEVGQAIATIETDFQSNLEEMYVNMHRTTFKSMRRFLPISRQPMNWQTAQHSLAQEVNSI